MKKDYNTQTPTTLTVELKACDQNASDYTTFVTSTEREDDVVLRVTLDENMLKLIVRARELIKSATTGCSVRVSCRHEEVEGMEWDYGSACAISKLLIYDHNLFLECTNKHSQDTIEWALPEPDWDNLQLN